MVICDMGEGPFVKIILIFISFGVLKALIVERKHQLAELEARQTKAPPKKQWITRTKWFYSVLIVIFLVFIPVAISSLGAYQIDARKFLYIAYALFLTFLLLKRANP